jgi:hypothetical protein
MTRHLVPVEKRYASIIRRTRAHAPDWCVKVFHYGDALVVADNRGRYWTAQRCHLYKTHKRKALIVEEVLRPVFGPCEKIKKLMT